MVTDMKAENYEVSQTGREIQEVLPAALISYASFSHYQR